MHREELNPEFRSTMTGTNNPVYFSGETGGGLLAGLTDGVSSPRLVKAIRNAPRKCPWLRASTDLEGIDSI